MVDDKRFIESREGFDMECSLLAHVRADRGSDVGAADVTQRRVIGAELMKLCRQEVECHGQGVDSIISSEYFAVDITLQTRF